MWWEKGPETEQHVQCIPVVFSLHDARGVASLILVGTLVLIVLCKDDHTIVLSREDMLHIDDCN